MLYQRGKGKTIMQKNGRQRTERVWWYRFRFGTFKLADGKVKPRIIHESSKSTSLTVAREAEKQRRRQLEESWNGIKKRGLPPTFEIAARKWLADQEGRVAANTITSARFSLKHLLPIYGSKLISDIAPDDVTAYQQKRLKEGAQGKTINIEFGVMRQILKANDSWAHLADKVKSLPVRKGLGRALTPDEESRLLAECAKTDSACYTAVVVALNTTMRKDEIRRLQWGQVDLFESKLTVGKSKTEAGTGRVIPLNASAVKALADWGEKFPARQSGDEIFPLGWRKAWRNALRRAGLKLRFHDLRHTAITKLAEGQASDQTIMSIAGHVSRAMLEHYSHIRMAAKRAALDSISTPVPYTSTLPKQADFRPGVNQNGNQVGAMQKEAGRKLLN